MTGPLAGCRVVVCRPAEQAGPLLATLRAAGADPVALPLIEVRSPADGGAALGTAAGHLERYRWVLLTSANGVRALAAARADRPWPREVLVGTVGPATAAAARAAGIPVELARPSGTGADLAAAVPPPGPGGGTVLLPVAELAGPALAHGLTAAGWVVDRVEAYRTLSPEPGPGVLERAVAADAVLFTAPSTVDRLVDLAGGAGVPALVVCIGPSTAARARHHGLAVAAVADEQGDDGLVRALARCWPPA